MALAHSLFHCNLFRNENKLFLTRNRLQNEGLGWKMKKGKKKLLPAAAFAALAAAAAIYLILLNIEKNLLSDFEKTAVLRAREEIRAGAVINESNLGEYFEFVQLDKALVPEKAVIGENELIGKLAAAKIDAGSFITDAMFSDITELTGTMREPVVAGFKADDLFQVAGGILRRGDRIHIYTIDVQNSLTYLIWEDIYVIDVFDSSGSSIVPDDRKAAAQRVNILLEKDSVEQFYSELAAGSLRVVKVVKDGEL